MYSCDEQSTWVNQLYSDQKINKIEERVQEAIDLLRQLTTEVSKQQHTNSRAQLSPEGHAPALSIGSTACCTPANVSITSSSKSAEHVLPLRVPPQPSIEGDSSFIAQTALASNMFGSSLDGSSPGGKGHNGSDLDRAINALREIMKTQKEYNAVHDSLWSSFESPFADVPIGSYDPADLIPVDVAMTTVRWARGSNSFKSWSLLSPRFILS